MASFVMECPSCGRYVEAKTGFFARKKIDCTCGYTINVRTDKLTGRVCPHCGNNVVFDQSKADQAKCPVCNEPINTMEEQSKVVEFSCGQCGVRLRAAKGTDTYTCPVCDHVNKVAERAELEEAKKSGLASIIRYEGDNATLVWKHPLEDFNMGSQLIVHESQEAIFFRDGQALDLFGAGRYTLETQQLPLLEKIYQLPTDSEATFHSEVYFINRATQMGIKWGTDSKVRLFDPISGLHVELGASGEFNIRVENARKLLLRIVGTTGGLSSESLVGNLNSKGIFRSLIMTQVKSFLAQTIKENQISVLEIDEHLMTLSASLREKINQSLEDYGLMMPEFFVSRVVTPDDDPNFRRMKEQYARQYLSVREEEIRKREAEAAAERKAVEAQTDARMQIIHAQGSAEAMKIQKQAEAEAYRMQAAAEAAEMQMKGYSYQQETSRMVGMEAMKNGLTGEGGSGIIGDLAGLGASLGVMGGVAGMAKDMLNPVVQGVGGAFAAGAQNGAFGDSQMGQSSLGNGVPGAATPAHSAPGDSWNCSCGAAGITSKFCPECGAKRPEPKLPATWNCPNCGAAGITSKFCPECGTRKPEKTTWCCPNCGAKEITSRFCPECGTAKPE
ncbi:MAG: SPFH domain-containing protein [Lachnospiraceae bacterium]|nr:SPFH domain-containing protein [Lachnospiraceae bacterium]